MAINPNLLLHLLREIFRKGCVSNKVRMSAGVNFRQQMAAIRIYKRYVAKIHREFFFPKRWRQLLPGTLKLCNLFTGNLSLNLEGHSPWFIPVYRHSHWIP